LDVPLLVFNTEYHAYPILSRYTKSIYYTIHLLCYMKEWSLRLFRNDSDTSRAFVPIWQDVEAQPCYVGTRTMLKGLAVVIFCKLVFKNGVTKFLFYYKFFLGPKKLLFYIGYSMFFEKIYCDVI
jgi:hypothetical protein